LDELVENSLKRDTVQWIAGMGAEWLGLINHIYFMLAIKLELIPKYCKKSYLQNLFN
jgi:hypothetical protein